MYTCSERSYLTDFWKNCYPKVLQDISNLNAYIREFEKPSLECHDISLFLNRHKYKNLFLEKQQNYFLNPIEDIMYIIEEIYYIYTEYLKKLHNPYIWK